MLVDQVPGRSFSRFAASVPSVVHCLHVEGHLDVVGETGKFSSKEAVSRFAIGVGSIVLTVNASLLAAYSFGCHSFRHLFGGRLDCFTCDSPSKTQHSTWKFSTWFNERHMQIAWISLGFVMFTDIYIRAVSHGLIPDLNTWGANLDAASRIAGL